MALPLAPEVYEAAGRLRAANLPQVVAAGVLHLAMLVASALCWRYSFGAFGGRIGSTDACVRYGVGTFLNAVAPARAGGAVRIGLFTRSLTGERSMQRSGTALLAIASVRGVSVTTFLAGAAAIGLAPRWLVAAPAAMLVPAILARRRLQLIRENLRRHCVAVLLGWAALAATCRWMSIVAALDAVGVPSPATAGLVGWLGLELAALLPLAPGLAGVGAAAVATAISAHGVASGTAVAGGVTFYAAESVAGVVFGAVATGMFLIRNRTPVERLAPA